MRSRSLIFVTTDRRPETLRLAYSALIHADTLATYFSRYGTHDGRQHAVMRGSIAVLDVPQPVASKIEKELSGSGAWRLGTGAQLEAARENIEAARKRAMSPAH